MTYTAPLDVVLARLCMVRRPTLESINDYTDPVCLQDTRTSNHSTVSMQTSKRIVEICGGG
jgi:hypothetical protein